MRTKHFLFLPLAALLLAAMPVTNTMAEEPVASGDSLSAVSTSSDKEPQDTTFFYEGEDSDEVVVTHDDWDDFAKDVDEMASEWGADTWWGKLLGGTIGLLGGGVGLLGGALAFFFAILVLVLLLAVLTAPLWVLALVILLIIKGTKGTTATPAGQTTTTATPASAATASPAANVSPAAEASSDANASTTTAYQASPLTGDPQTAMPRGSSITQQEMWKSGIMWSCIGVGLVCVFLGIGLDGLWGIGVLVACIGVAKLIIATTSRPK